MFSLSNLRISTRLAAGFLLVLALTGTIGIVGMNSSAQLADVTVRFHDHPFTVIQNIGKARVAFRMIRMDARDLILAETPQEIAKAEADIADNSRTLLSAMQVAKPAYLGDKTQFDESIAAFTAYRAVLDDIAAKVKTGDRAAALALLRGKGAELSKLSADKDTAIQDFADKKGDSFMVAANAVSADVERLSIGLLIVSLISGGAIAFFIARSIAMPINAMTDAATRMAGGDLAVIVPGVGRGDEIGQMAAAVEVFRTTALTARQLATRQTADERRNRRKVQSQMLALTNAIEEEVTGAISVVVKEADSMNGTSNALAGLVDESRNGSQGAASASELANASVDAVAAAAEELSASVQEISRQVATSSQVASEAEIEASKVNEIIQGLAEAARNVGAVVNLITDIASQTNLLALNATIEAARAGDAGKGFAVVAGEVKNLANQTGRATEEIGQQITAIQAATADAVGAIQGIGATISRINGISGSIAAAVEEQSAATQEIARSAQSAARGTQEAASEMANVAHAIEETGRCSGEVRVSATSVRKQIDAMNASVETIIHSNSDANRHNTERHTVNLAATVTVKGQRMSCLLQDVARIGAGILDRPFDCPRGTEFTVELPKLGNWSGMVVAITEHNTHVHFELDEGQAAQLDKFIDSRARATS